MTSELKVELEDFEAFLEPRFSALEFANDLVVATNGNESNELDLQTPIKKLKFDIEECDKRIRTIAGNNYEALVSNFSRIEDTRTILNDKINPSISRVNHSFERIKAEVIQPYDESLRLNNALKRIHTTLDLLRGASFFIFLIQQIESLEKSFDSENIKDLTRLARLHVQLSQLYESENNNNTKDSNILAIKLIRDYYPIQISKKNALIEQAIQIISNEFNHHSTFTEKNTNLENHLIAYYLLDQDSFFQTFDRSVINKQVQHSLTNLSRSLQSPRNFTAIISEIKESSEEYFQRLSHILSAWEVSKNPNGIDSRSFEDLLQTEFNVDSLFQLFWSKLCLRFKKNIVATMARGGPTAKNLKVYYDGLKNTVLETFKSEYERDLLLDAIEIISSGR
ncbi:Golgi transport complex subunit 5-domain-containing protein [Scheffersomyces amazonensis]|uniref:Golgi transport complex subunit 5-domain-containing protein n=1 Tax=Scheffersomyces amazonensis TaxID=1078765 RepID=UPI00315D4658